MSNEDPRLIPVQKALIQDTAVAINTDFLAANIAPTKPPSIFRIMIALSAATRFEADITYGGTEKTVYFNSGIDLAADCLYTFDMIVCSGDTVNFQINDNGITIRIFRVIEIPAAI